MENNKPYFHQIVIDDYIAQRVRIPPLFMKHLSKDMSEKETTEATIKCGVGLWAIKLRKTSKYTYIEDGWTRVMQDNALGDKEFLVFRYEGNMCFNLQIFEKTGCERIYPKVVFNKCKKRGDFAKKTDNLECFPKERDDAQGNATFSNTVNPHFSKVMKECHVQRSFLLRLPSDFSARLCSPTGRMTIIELENSKGEVWKVNAYLNTGSYCLCGGWRTFVLANKIKVGDECKFELLSKKRIRVHHFKA